MGGSLTYLSPLVWLLDINVNDKVVLAIQNCCVYQGVSVLHDIDVWSP